MEVADGVVNNWMPAWKQSAAWLIAPDMDIMAAVCPGALAAVAALKRLLGRDEVMDVEWEEAAGVRARLPGFEILAAFDISVVREDGGRARATFEKIVWFSLSDESTGECVEAVGDSS